MTPILSLLQKEWHDQRWKLAFGCVILMGFTAIGLRTRIVADDSILLGAMALGAFLLPLFIGMGVVAADRAEGSLATLLALPVRPIVVLTTKMAVAWMACALPLIGVGLVTWGVAGQREIGWDTAASLVLFACGAAGMVLLWTVALGIRQATEARAALAGAVFLAIGFGGVLLSRSVLVRYWIPQDWLSDACVFHPAAWVWPPLRWSDARVNTGVIIAAQVVAAVVLCMVMVRRLGPATGARR